MRVLVRVVVADRVKSNFMIITHFPSFTHSPWLHLLHSYVSPFHYSLLLNNYSTLSLSLTLPSLSLSSLYYYYYYGISINKLVIKLYNSKDGVQEREKEVNCITLWCNYFLSDKLIV